jgi:phosphonoacetaldehyde hydrolase
LQGNYVGMSEAQLAQADPNVLAARMKVAHTRLYDAGAHFVIETINDLPNTVDEINRRIQMGIRP